jgi:(p)ppGpp synthase/HD superfamily hydrolase
LNPGPKVDSVSLRQGSNGQRTIEGEEEETHEVPVRLEWSGLDTNKVLYLAEIVVVARDRKLLLADCSEVVSETVNIVKTGSSLEGDNATLIFLVQVNGLESIQQLIDRLQNIRSVISVERRFGSELLL